jgi:hypothetical protein
MWEFLSHVHFGPVGHFIKQHKRSQTQLSLEILVAKLQDHNSQSNHLHSAHSSSPSHNLMTKKWQSVMVTSSAEIITSVATYQSTHKYESV